MRTPARSRSARRSPPRLENAGAAARAEPGPRARSRSPRARAPPARSSRPPTAAASARSARRCAASPAAPAAVASAGWAALGVVVAARGCWCSARSSRRSWRSATWSSTARSGWMPRRSPSAVDGQLGVPLALLDEDRIRAELGEFSLIRSYVTELVPPGHAPDPHRRARADRRDRVGRRIPARPTRRASRSRRPSPARRATRRSSWPPGRTSTGAGFRSMAEVLLALPPAVLAQVDTIAARTRDDVTLTLTGSAQRVVWGSADDSESKAAVLAEPDRAAHRGRAGGVRRLGAGHRRLPQGLIRRRCDRAEKPENGATRATSSRPWTPHDRTVRDEA